MSLLVLSGRQSTWPPVHPRAPLPPFDLAGPYQVHTTLPANVVIPSTIDKRFLRGNAWAVTVPGGLPFVPQGTSSVHPDRLLTWFLDEYVARDPGSFDRAVAAYLGRGYSHWLLSRGGGFGQQAPVAYAALAQRLKRAGVPYLCHMLTAKTIDPPSAPAQIYIDRVQPYVDALLTVDALDTACLGWELNLFWNPTELQRFKEWLRQYLPREIDIAAHFGTFVTAWQLPGHDRADFYADGIVKELWYQTDPWANLGTIQAHLNDAQRPASGLQAHSVRLVACEIKAAAQFDGSPIGNEHPNEDDGDMYSFGALCTPGEWPVNGGYLGGGRYPDGSWL